MKKIYYLAFLLSSTLLFTACEKEKPVVKKQEEVYDWHNEKYQDFYSQYMRKAENAPLNFQSEDFQKILKLSNVPNNIYVKVNVYRRKPFDKTITATHLLKNKIDIIRYFDNLPHTEKYVICNDDSERDLFCLQEKSHPSMQVYFYILNEYRKLDYIEQVIMIHCHPFNNEKECYISDNLNHPYNIKYTIDFYNPKNFFYIMPYIENHFYQTTGNHLWQSSPNKN